AVRPRSGLALRSAVAPRSGGALRSAVRPRSGGPPRSGIAPRFEGVAFAEASLLRRGLGGAGRCGRRWRCATTRTSVRRGEVGPPRGLGGLLGARPPSPRGLSEGG